MRHARVLGLVVLTLLVACSPTGPSRPDAGTPDAGPAATPTCDDGEKNGAEIGADCGGLCVP